MRRLNKPLTDRDLYAQHRQLQKMKHGEPHERNTFMNWASPRRMEEAGLITCVERGERHQAWYTITDKGRDYINVTPEPPSPYKRTTEYPFYVRQ